MKGFIATEDIWKVPLRLWNILLSTHLRQVLSSQVTVLSWEVPVLSWEVPVWPQKSLFCRQEFLCCLQKPLFCLQKSLFCLQKSVFGTSLIRHTARSSAADRLWMRTPGATAGRRTRQTMVDEEVVDPEAAARSTDYLISRSFARRLPSFLPVRHVRRRPLSHRPSLISPCVVFETNPALFAFSNYN